MSRILIVSSEQDAHARVVAWSLEQTGFGVDYWDTSFAIQQRGHSVHLRADATPDISILGESDYRSAWLRRVLHTKTFSEGTEQEDIEYIQRESRRYVDAVLERMQEGNTRWLNGKTAAIHAEYKLEQIEACRKLGIRFPETLISSDPDTIRRFVEKFGYVVVKPLDVYTWHRDDGSQLMTYANTLTAELLATIEDSQLLLCPAIYQEPVKKSLDIRVVYVNGSAFACSIDNPNKESIDFRPFQTDGSLIFNPYPVDDAFLDDISLLSNHFRINLASSDFCLDENGDRYFLDLNPGGAFLFVEYYGGGPIVAHVAAALAGDRDASKFPGLTDYNAWASEENRISGA